MKLLNEFLAKVRQEQVPPGCFLGFLHILIGKTLVTRDGALVSRGITWRELAARMRQARLDKDLVRELGVDPGQLPPRDREAYWFEAMRRAPVSSPQAQNQAAQLVSWLEKLGYEVDQFR
ncbi:MAG: hypothetical protein LW700_07390 [Gemmataceae bacterium]|jgi:hypothetical protein|nr:hypothetical protein [Gemmataceae bacterium]